MTDYKTESNALVGMLVQASVDAGMALNYAHRILAAGFHLTPTVQRVETERCSSCGHIGGGHGLVHTRYPQGGGGTNTPCPLTPAGEINSAERQAFESSPAVHFLEVTVEESRDPRLDLVCTAEVGAACRRRPPAEDKRERWNDDDPDLIDGACWAVEFVDAYSLSDTAWCGNDATLARIPVAIDYDEGLILSPVVPHQALDLVMPDAEQCEAGCGPAVTQDSEGTPLCQDCDNALQLAAAHDMLTALRGLIAEIDASPAVTWAGPGGVKSLLLAQIEAAL